MTVTATNTAGSAEQSFAVTVLPPAPTATGSIEAATISEGDTHEVIASDYFGGEGVAYGAESSDAGVASVAVDGAAVTVTAVAAGNATVTVTATNLGGSAEQSFAVTVLPPAPAAVGSIEAATITEGGTYTKLIASDYFAGEGVTYGAESSDSEVASVEVRRRGSDGDGSRRRQRDGDGDGDERGRERGAVVRRDGAAARAGGSRQHRGGDNHRGRQRTLVTASDHFERRGAPRTGLSPRICEFATVAVDV